MPWCATAPTPTWHSTHAGKAAKKVRAAQKNAQQQAAWGLPSPPPTPAPALTLPPRSSLLVALERPRKASLPLGFQRRWGGRSLALCPQRDWRRALLRLGSQRLPGQACEKERACGRVATQTRVREVPRARRGASGGLRKATPSTHFVCAHPPRAAAVLRACVRRASHSRATLTRAEEGQGEQTEEAADRGNLGDRRRRRRGHCRGQCSQTTRARAPRCAFLFDSKVAPSSPRVCRSGALCELRGGSVGRGR